MVPVKLVAGDPVHARIALERQAFFSTASTDRGLAGPSIRQAMVSPLIAESGLIGAMIVANRLTEGTSFDDDDLRLLETLANQAAVALENGQLEQSLAELSRLKEELRHQAYHDPLTGLANRSLFAERVEEQLAAPREGLRTVVLFLDLDDFKIVNDTLGHAAGDRLLAAVADRIRGCIRADDLAARLGGDEFAVLLTDEIELERALAVAKRMIDALQVTFPILGQEISIGGSIGIAVGRGMGEHADELLRNADVAMYTAKAAGKRRAAVFEPTMHAAIVARHALSAELKRSMGRGELAVFYQPIVELDTGRIAGAEALVRWRHPARGLLLPGEFLPLAEEMGLAGVIGGRVLRTACEQLRAWQDADPGRALSMSVQVATAQLRQSSFTAEVADAVARSGVDAASLVLEIASAALGGDADGWRETLSALKSLGVRLAVDDFGTGYAPLSHVGDLPFDVLKVAKTFVDGLDRGERRAALCEAVIAMGQSLRLVVVADGVERPEQLRALRRLGCVRAQGHLLGRPVPAAELTPLLVLELAPR
jgi:diguanylate cyclase (GGDEF)-like protein